MVAVRCDLIHRVAAITEYTETGFFIAELDKDGAEAPPNWFGQNPDDGEDSTEEIASSNEGEDDEGEESEDVEPAGGTAS